MCILGILMVALVSQSSCNTGKPSQHEWRLHKAASPELPAQPADSSTEDSSLGSIYSSAHLREVLVTLFDSLWRLESCEPPTPLQ